MRPDQLLIEAILTEAVRMSDLPENIRLRPRFIGCLDKIIGRPRVARAPVVGPAGMFTASFRAPISTAEIDAVVANLGLDEHLEPIKAALTLERLVSFFDAGYTWEGEEIKLSCGETTLSVKPATTVKLMHDQTLRYEAVVGDLKVVIRDGQVLPVVADMTAAAVDAIEDARERGFLVEELGVEKYLRSTETAETLEDEHGVLIKNDQFAILDLGDVTLRVPASCEEPADAVAWEALYRSGQI